MHSFASRAISTCVRIRFVTRFIAVVAAANLTIAAAAFAEAVIEPVNRSVIPGLLAEPIEVQPGLWYLGPGPSGGILAPHNANAADTTNADQLRPGGGLGLNLSGAGTTVGVWDGGAVRATHEQLNGRVSVIDAVSLNFHATHVAGTIGGSGAGNPSARGMAGGVDIRSRDFNNDVTEMALDMGGGLIDLSNHSYGQRRGWNVEVFDVNLGNEDFWFGDRTRNSIDPNFGKYDQEAHDIDAVLNQNQNVLSVWSAGNDRNNQYNNLLGNNTYVTFLSLPDAAPGLYRVNTLFRSAPGMDGNFDCLPNGGQTAKNTLVVGAINDITSDPYNNGDVVMSSFSSWGPTDDGRLGVDVVANGVSLTSALETSNTAYGTLSGTSMAAPNVTGTLALIREHTINEKGAAPTAATLKGLAIHTAFDSGNPGPDYTYGWGVLDAAAAATFVTDTEAANPEDFIFENSYSGTPWTMKVMANGTGPLKATLNWQDPGGTALTSDIFAAVLNDPTSALVNDLDLWIEDSIGNTYYPWDLNPAMPGANAFRTALNHRENTEQVLIDLPTAGLYTIYVGHTGGIFNQNYSLLFSGAAAVPEPTALVLILVGLVGVQATRRRSSR